MSTDTEGKPLQDNSEKTVTDDGYSAERRRFLFKGAVISAPVIMTVASRPVWAGGWRKWHGGGGGGNCTLSGQLSGNLSTPDQECGGEGCTPGYWKQDQHLDSWHPDLPPSASFLDVFGQDAFPGLTLLEVVRLMDFDVTSRHADLSIFNPPPGCNYMKKFGQPDLNKYNLLRQLGFHSVAALQNAATSVSYDITVADVIASFTDAYLSCSSYKMNEVKDTLDYLNNQYCPLN